MNREEMIFLKTRTLFLFLALAFLAGFAGRAQQPQQSPAPAATTAQPPQQKRTFPEPKNLKVLPKNLTGEQVHEIMEQWEGALGGHCGTCHTPDPTNIGPNGRPRLNFADDSKDEKQTARKMYQMVQEINQNYISKIDSSGAPVTCGTCHRGHLGPQPFVPPPDEHDHDHAVPPQQPPANQVPANLGVPVQK